jgi:glycosyltransferase involved in cell wall biosynthesis
MVEAILRRLNILFISNLFPTPADPTRGIFTFQLIKRLSTMCNLTVVCPLPWFPRWARNSLFMKWHAFSHIPYQYEWHGTKVFSPKYPIIPKLSEPIHAALMFPSLYRTVRRLNRNIAFDAVNTQWLYPDGVAAVWTTSLLKLPHVVTALGCDANLFMKQSHKRPQIEWALRKADGLTVVSDALRQFLMEEGLEGKRIDVIPNGVDTELFFPRDKDECAKQLCLHHKGKSVVFVGQLLEVKGIIYLIEAAELLATKRRDFFVYLVGEGADREAYKAEIARRGLTNRIRLVGNRPHSEIALWMGAADVFCLPSIREGFPNVVLEALFSGRPVVASRVGGIPEMVNENNGILVEAKNPDALAVALNDVLSREWDYRSILSTVLHLSWERASRLYLLSLYSAIKNRKGMEKVENE